MNCTKCGALVPAGVYACPVCGAPLSGVQGYAGTAAVNGGYAAYPNGGYQPVNAQPAYAQGSWGYGADAPVANGGFAQGYNGYPQGYQQTYGQYDTAGSKGSELREALAALPRVFTGAFSDPGETLRGLMERGDRYTGAIVVGLSLLLTFLTAILVMRGAAAGVVTGLSGLLGTSLAGDADGVNQGVNYIAGKMSVSVGGIAALCQLIAVVFPAATALTYLCAVKKVRFSFLLASNLTAIVTLPGVAASVLCMTVSLISPYIGAVVLLLGVIAGYALLSALITWATGMPEQRLVPAKIAVIGGAEVLKLLFFWLVGGALASAAFQTVSGLVSNMGSLL